MCYTDEYADLIGDTRWICDAPRLVDCLLIVTVIGYNLDEAYLSIEPTGVLNMNKALYFSDTTPSRI
jgi:hypothetical protein